MTNMQTQEVLSPEEIDMFFAGVKSGSGVELVDWPQSNESDMPQIVGGFLVQITDNTGESRQMSGSAYLAEQLPPSIASKPEGSEQRVGIWNAYVQLSNARFMNGADNVDNLAGAK